jgi:hypothetical protein
MAGFPFFGLVEAQHAARGAQPAEVLQTSAHHAMSAAANGPVDMVLVGVGVVVVIVTTFYSLLYLIRPGEKRTDHIKRRILEDGHEAFQ